MSRPELAQYVGEGEGKGRAYKHPFRKLDTGKPLVVPSVTTILKLEAKDALVQWSADKTLEWCVVNWNLLGSRSPEDAYKSARFRWREVRDERAFVGTGIHDTIESIHTGGWDFPTLDREQSLIMLEWDKLNEEYEIEPLMSEFTCWSLAHEYAGTADGLWKFTNRLTGETFIGFIDLKTSKNVWDAHRMQIAALVHCDVVMRKVVPDAVRNSKGEYPEGTWVEEPMPPWDNLKLVHLRAPEFDDLGRVTQEGKHDLIDVTEDHDLWFEEFLGYRSVAATQQKRKDREKERESSKYGSF